MARDRLSGDDAALLARVGTPAFGHDDVPVLADAMRRAGVDAEIERLIAYLRRAPFPLLRDIALTTGLAAHEALSRAAIVATSTADLLDKLLLLQRRLSWDKTCGHGSTRGF